MTENNRIKLSWPQIVWAITMLVVVVSSWADTRSQIALLNQRIAMKIEEQEKENGRIWQAIDETKEKIRANR